MLELNTTIFTFLSQYNTLMGVGIIADFPIFFLPIFLVFMWLYYTFKKQDNTTRLKLMYIFYSCIIGVIFSYIIKQFIEIERPESYLETTGHLIMSQLPEKSFPSEHANVSFAFVGGLFFSGFKKVAWCFLPCAIVMNICRIIIGVHWPLDILAGSILGFFSAWLFFTHISQLKLVKKLDVLIINIMKYIKLY